MRRPSPLRALETTSPLETPTFDRTSQAPLPTTVKSQTNAPLLPQTSQSPSQQSSSSVLFRAGARTSDRVAQNGVDTTGSHNLGQEEEEEVQQEGRAITFGPRLLPGGTTPWLSQ